jgi:protein PhnA
MSDELKPCPKCEYPYGYALDDHQYTCPDCQHTWQPSSHESGIPEVKDAHGNTLQNGDSVIVMKDLPVKGAPKPLKAGTKVKNIRLVDSDHNISCKIDGFGAMALKSEFVKKAN